MKKIVIPVAVAATTALLVPASFASAQSTGPRHACSAQHRFLGSRSGFRWWRGTSRDPADESFRTTTYRYGSGSCARIAFSRWVSISNFVFGRADGGKRGGAFTGPGIQGSWRRIKIVEVPNTCEGDGADSSTPYGWFGLRVSNLDGRLIGTGTVKLRLAC